MSSASRPSDADVKPTRSANRTVTTLRSATGPFPPDETGAAVEVRAAPHSPQNLTPGGFAVPHAAHLIASAFPHSPQNFRPASFADPWTGRRRT